MVSGDNLPRILAVNVTGALSVDPQTVESRTLAYPNLLPELTAVKDFIAAAKKLLASSTVLEVVVREYLEEQIAKYRLLDTALQLQQTRTHLKTSLDGQTEDFVSEKPEAQGEVAIATSTRGEGFAATKDLFGARGGFEMGSNDRARETQLSQRFTEASVAIYGAPDPRTVEQLARHELARFRTMTGPDNAQLKVVLQTYERLLASAASPADDRPFFADQALLDKLKTELYKRYGTIFDLFDESATYTVQQVAHKLEAARQLLAAHDSGWREWSVVTSPAVSIFSSSSTHKQLRVGLRRQAMTGQECQAIVAHELLAHAQRAVNGAKAGDRQLAVGLPDCESAEEGVAVLFEAAITGTIPAKIVDRYLDTALALKGLKRQEMFRFALARNQVRAQAHHEHEPGEDSRTWVQVNRVYRGSRGDEVVGVLTKDIAYYQGFVKIADFVSQQLAGGMSISKVTDMLLAGRLDPTNPDHVAYAQRRGPSNLNLKTN